MLEVFNSMKRRFWAIGKRGEATWHKGIPCHKGKSDNSTFQLARDVFGSEISKLDIKNPQISVEYVWLAGSNY